ncbi:NACHT and WD40 domain protein [Penicillium psychrosexuale]|uniref:NACHT and WD40 domain protein n=1 Tax=Penicillium psychrosexuale TaxID=1002107 RepID=UPI0025450BBF|nr:NACHT and WD40 domain protein [Penicillium psychrosexuale]KAJ5800726.1 NACHT and WD40 domain protein [Penicillium psychrosexuale]
MATCWRPALMIGQCGSRTQRRVYPALRIRQCGSGTQRRVAYSRLLRVIHTRLYQWPSYPTAGYWYLVLIIRQCGSRTRRRVDIATGSIQQTLKGHSHWVISVAFLPNGRLLASSSNNKTDTKTEGLYRYSRVILTRLYRRLYRWHSLLIAGYWRLAPMIRQEAFSILLRAIGARLSRLLSRPMAAY